MTCYVLVSILLAISLLNNCYTIIILASCPWGPVTANGVDLLTEMYVIYMETKIRSLGPLGAAGAGVTYARKKS